MVNGGGLSERVFGDFVEEILHKFCRGELRTMAYWRCGIVELGM